MSRELVIEPTPSGARAGLLEDGRLIEAGIADADAIPARGQVLLGRVRSIDHDLDAAFVDCGLGADGYLAARDARVLSGEGRATPIGRQLREGQAVVVQVRRDPQGGKGPRLTADVALAGPCLVLRPRQAGGGLAERPAARRATAAELSAEADRLRRVWQTIESKAGNARPPARLHGETEPVRWLLAEHLGDSPDRIVVGDPAALARARSYLAEWRPGLTNRLEHLPDAFAASGTEEQLSAALEPLVELPGGGRLTIQEAAALTAIDVDGAGRRPLDVDLAAADEIALQLRLRRLGGTIVVDFVDLAAKRERALLLARLRAALAADPAPVQVYPMTPLGLVEISRQRLGPTLAEHLGRRCPCCAGSGVLPSIHRRSEELMRDLARRPPGQVSAALAPDLHAHLTGAGATSWSTFAKVQGRAPDLEVDAALAPGGYRLEEVSR